MNIVAEFFTQLLASVTGWMDAYVSAIGGITEVFWDSTEGFTIAGLLLLITVGVGVVSAAFAFIKSLI